MIAYCLAGHTRGFEMNPILTEFSTNRFNTYVSTWKDRGSDLTFWQGGIERESPIDESALRQNYSPIKISIESRSDYEHLDRFDRPFEGTPVNVLNTLLMFKKIKQSIELANSNHYTIIRSRFDIQHIIPPVSYTHLTLPTIYSV